ncbi:MAG: PilW family protein, partial [Wenzhouxiangellaceae bacterium]
MNSPNRTVPDRCRGLSLVELMVAITLGVLLTAGMVQLFNASKLTFRTNDALSRVQENGRFALEMLKRELREAGATGFCSGRIEVRNHLNTGCAGGTDDFFNPNRAVVGWEYGGTGRGDAFTLPDDLDPATATNGEWDSTSDTADLPDRLSGLVVPGSDVVVVRRMEPISGVTAEEGPPPNNPNQASINLVGSHGLPDDAIVLVTNCSFADLFQNRSNASASALSTGTGSCSNPGPGNQSISSVPWSTSYGSDMQLLNVVQVAYYIGLNANGQPGLYRWNMSNGTSAAFAEELIEGAETMQILYGFSAASPAGDGQSVNNWLTASEVSADGWQQVLALRLALSVRSPETADFDRTQLTFDLADADIAITGDGRIRQP